MPQAQWEHPLTVSDVSRDHSVSDVPRVDTTLHVAGVTHVGWDAPTREARLHLVVGNARFLILPYIQVPNLASAILARVARRLRADWQTAYGYEPVLLETFVETGRFTGTCYRAANWLHVGQTKGRGKLDRKHEHKLPVKDIYLYPLHRHYRRILTAPI